MFNSLYYIITILTNQKGSNQHRLAANLDALVVEKTYNCAG